MTAEQILATRQRIVDAMKILLRDGLCELNTGHISVRDPETQLIHVPGHIHDFGRTLDTLTVDDIITIDMEGRKVEGKLNGMGERFIHTEVLKRRPDVNSVVHVHPKLAVCFSIAGVEILPVYHRAAIFSPKVPIWDYPGQVDTPEIAADMARALGDNYAVLLRAHGAVAVGATLEECVSVIAILERCAEMQYHAMSIGKARAIEPEFLDGKHIKGQNHANWVRNIWGFLAHNYLRS